MVVRGLGMFNYGEQKMNIGYLLDEHTKPIQLFSHLSHNEAAIILNGHACHTTPRQNISLERDASSRELQRSKRNRLSHIKCCQCVREHALESCLLNQAE